MYREPATAAIAWATFATTDVPVAVPVVTELMLDVPRIPAWVPLVPAPLITCESSFAAYAEARSEKMT